MKYLGQPLFSTSSIGKAIIRPMGIQVATVIYPDGSMGTKPGVGEEIARGDRKIHLLGDLGRVDNFNVNDIDGCEFATMDRGAGFYPVLLSFNRDDYGNKTGYIDVVTDSGARFTYKAISIQLMVNDGEILVYKS